MKNNMITRKNVGTLILSAFIFIFIAAALFFLTSDRFGEKLLSVNVDGLNKEITAVIFNNEYTLDKDLSFALIKYIDGIGYFFRRIFTGRMFAVFGKAVHSLTDILKKAADGAVTLIGCAVKGNL